MTYAPRSALHRAADAAARRGTLRALNAFPWAGNVLRWALHVPARASTGAAPDAVIAIPARNERERIDACLTACAASVRASGRRVRTLVLVNGSTDDTAEVALGWARRNGAPVTVVDVDFRSGMAHAGAARRLALELAALDVPRETALLTTDADARPGRSWVGGCVSHLRAGAALVCGNACIDAREAQALPVRLEAFAALERRYRRASLELEHLIDPDPWNPWPHHGVASGASLAIDAGTLADIGGSPLVACGEDRALLRLVRARGLRAVHADDIEVDVSGRTRGRACGGMADTLRSRLGQTDPTCDEALLPARALHARLLARAALRTRWPVRSERSAALDAALDRLGVEGRSDPAPRNLLRSLERVDGFDRVWDELDRALIEPRRTRLRFSALARELPELLALVRRVRAAAPRRAAAVPTRARAPRPRAVARPVRAIAAPADGTRAGEPRP